MGREKENKMWVSNYQYIRQSPIHHWLSAFLRCIYENICIVAMIPSEWYLHYHHHHHHHHHHHQNVHYFLLDIITFSTSPVTSFTLSMFCNTSVNKGMFSLFCFALEGYNSQYNGIEWSWFTLSYLFSGLMPYIYIEAERSLVMQILWRC